MGKILGSEWLRLLPALLAFGLGGCSALFDFDDFDFDGGDGGQVGAPATPTLVAPVNGFHTGSVHVAAGSPVVDHPLRPRFTWLPVTGATSYEIQLDDNCPVANFALCTFPSPVTETTAGTAAPSGSGLLLRPTTPLPVSMTQPVGARYAWRMRACNSAGCSGWSQVRYLNVGRDRSDFNGDGYADLVVGSAGYMDAATNHRGAVYVYHGSMSGVDTGFDRFLQGADIGYFGISVASAGDVNGDGYADLVIGAHQEGTGVLYGRIYIFHGTPAGISAAADNTIDNPIDTVWSGYFGVSVASAGDVNGDGYDDIVVGAYNQPHVSPTGQGNAYVFHGSSTGVDDTPDQTLNNPLDDATGAFGYSVAGAGDVDGDGYADVVVGAATQSGTNAGEGKAYVYHGGAVGISASHDRVLDNPTGDADGRFGSSVASAGDVNGDGYADLAVGAHLQTLADEGKVYVYHGSAAGLPSNYDRELLNPTAQANGYFGISVASAGDVDGDGFADLVVGAHGQDGGEAAEGKSFVYSGSATGIDAPAAQTLDNPYASPGGGRFGVSVAGVGDVNGDGFPDVAVGADAQAGLGKAYVFHASLSGVDAAPSTTLDDPDTNLGSDTFGNSVATAAGIDDENGVEPSCDARQDASAYRQDASAYEHNSGACSGSGHGLLAVFGRWLFGTRKGATC